MTDPVYYASVPLGYDTLQTLTKLYDDGSFDYAIRKALNEVEKRRKTKVLIQNEAAIALDYSAEYNSCSNVLIITLKKSKTGIIHNSPKEVKVEEVD